MTTVIITGGIDLSVGSVMGLSAMMHAASSWVPAIPIVVGVAAGLGVALLVGLVNGVLIAYVSMPSFVVTLGMLSIARSQGQVWSNNKRVYKFGPDADLILWLGGGSTSRHRQSGDRARSC